METVTIYHNPACSRSRGALAILEERGISHEVVEYLRSPPSRDTLVSFLDKLAEEPAALVRQDKRFSELGLDPSHYTTREKVVELLSAHPELMQRPVVVRGDRAVIARPSEKVLEILD